MKRVVYRGVSFQEAKRVVASQRYDRAEHRIFQNGIQARSVFGPGLYLISDAALAAYYAFCHTEAEGGARAAVLKQSIQLENPCIINCRYTEKQLYQDAVSWKYSGCPLPDIRPEHLRSWIGKTTKEYLLAHFYDGIVYHIDESVIYYVVYFQEKQVKNIGVEFIFTMNGV